MRVALLGDLHFGVRNDSQLFQNHMEKFLAETFFPYLEENKINTIIQVGDVFDRRKYLNINTATRAYDNFISKCLKKKYDVHITLGNHDCFHTNTNRVSSVSTFLRQYDCFTIYDKTTEIEINGIKILMIPWINSENREDSLEKIARSNAMVAMGHLELAGFEMQKGVVCEHGDDHEIFSNFNRVFSGHFHKISSYKNIKYIGAAGKYTWGDYLEDRGFWDYDLVTEDLKFIPNPVEPFVKIWYDDSKEVSFNFENCQNAIVKIIVTQKNDLIKFEQFIETLEKIGPHDVQVVDDHLNLGIENIENIGDSSKSTIEIITDVVDSMKLKNKNEVKNMMVSLYTEALNGEKK